jgi:hypothetical protein
MHTVLVQRTQDQQYPWSTSELHASCLLNAFSAGVALARRITNKVCVRLKWICIKIVQNDATLSSTPVCVQSIQLCDGQLDMCVLQLNTLDNLRSPNDGDAIKNIAFFDSGKSELPAGTAE